MAAPSRSASPTLMPGAIRLAPSVAGNAATANPDPVWPAFAEAVQRYHIPLHAFEDMIEGQRQDLQPVPIETFDQLHAYCYRVASVVGLASIYVWGFSGGQATEALAVQRGIAFQLTNILRDLREDARKGRSYLPREDLARFNVTAADIAAAHGNGGFRDLMRFQIDRAEKFYADSASLDTCINKDSRPTLRAMTDIYHNLLAKIADDPARVLHERVRLNAWTKLLIGWRTVRAK